MWDSSQEMVQTTPQKIPERKAVGAAFVGRGLVAGPGGLSHHRTGVQYSQLQTCKLCRARLAEGLLPRPNARKGPSLVRDIRVLLALLAPWRVEWVYEKDSLIVRRHTGNKTGLFSFTLRNGHLS